MHHSRIAHIPFRFHFKNSSSVKNFVSAARFVVVARSICDAGREAWCLRVCFSLFLLTMNMNAEWEVEYITRLVYIPLQISPFSIYPGIKHSAERLHTEHGAVTIQQQFIARKIVCHIFFSHEARERKKGSWCMYIILQQFTCTSWTSFSHSSSYLNGLRVENVYFSVNWDMHESGKMKMGKMMARLPIWWSTRVLCLREKSRAFNPPHFTANVIIKLKTMFNCLIALCAIADLINCSSNEKSFESRVERDEKRGKWNCVDPFLINFIMHVIDANLWRDLIELS